MVLVHKLSIKTFQDNITLKSVTNSRFNFEIEHGAKRCRAGAHKDDTTKDLKCL